MSYIIYNTSGTVLTTIPSGKINTSTSSITLVGRDVLNYGKYYNQNLIDMLTNFANVSALPPEHPLPGQLWYDTTYNKLKVYEHDTGFKLVNAVEVDNSQPVGQVEGEFWYDTDRSTLNFLDANGQYQSITHFPRNAVSGWTYPPSPLANNDSDPEVQQVTLLTNHGDVIGAISTASFVTSYSDSVSYFSRAGENNFEIIDGLTLIGGIKVTGISQLGGVVTITTSTNSTGTNSGALVVAGGVGVGGKVIATELEVTNTGTFNTVNATSITFGDDSIQTTAFIASSYINISSLKLIVASCTNFTDFQNAIAAL
jgi:hypothetical protein